MLNIRSEISRKVLQYFVVQDGVDIYVNELGRVLSVESGNLTRKLLQLEQEGVLKSRWQGKQRYYSLNHEFPLLNEYRSILQKTFGFESALKESLLKNPDIQHALIFGSYAQGKMDAASDIDVLVVGNHKTVELQKTIAVLQKKNNREINVISLSPEEYRNKSRMKTLLRSIQGKKKIVIL